jgi:hypothetical protein
MINFKTKFIQDDIDICLKYIQRLGEWDKEFIQSIAKAFAKKPEDGLSHNNFKHLQEVAQKCRGMDRTGVGTKIINGLTGLIT